MLKWHDATKPAEIKKWREQVEALADSVENHFLHAFPPKKEKWRTEHVVTWLAGCAPGLDSADLFDLKKQKITGRSLFDHFKEPAPPRQAPFPYNLTAGAYNEIHGALVGRNLVPPGILLC